MRARPTIALLCLAALPACRLFVEPTSQRATRGAVTVIQEQAPEGEVGRPLARNTAIGLLDALSQPEQLRQLRLVAAAASAGALEGAASPTDELLEDPRACVEAARTRGLGKGARPVLCAAASAGNETPIEELAEQAAVVFVDTFTRKLIAQLGRNGQGPLADSVAATGERISGSAARGVRAELGNLFPECKGPERPRCIERRLEALGRAATSGVAKGLTGSQENKGAMADRLTQSLVAAFSRELIVQLGPEGEGPLARSLAAASQQLAASTLRGLRTELAPDCQEAGDTRCLERRLQALGRATSIGVAEGLASSFGWIPLLAGFLAGLLVAAVVALLAARLGARRAPPQPL